MKRIGGLLLFLLPFGGLLAVLWLLWTMNRRTR